MGFLQEYCRKMIDDLPDVQSDARLEYRPIQPEELELLRERGIEESGKILADPEGADALAVLVGMERLSRFQDPSGFRDEQLRQILETLHPGRGTEENVRAFRAALASRDVLRLRFIHDQCARAAAELSRLPEPEDDDDDDWEEPVILEDPEDREEWEEAEGDLW